VRVLILGARGFVGKALTSSFVEQNFSVYMSYRVDNLNLVTNSKKTYYLRDIQNYDALLQIIEKISPDIIINCIAMADVNTCETNPDAAHATNNHFPSLLAKASNRLSFKLVHLSTDAVFGQDGSYFTEEDKPTPKSVYGISKYLGEEKILSTNDSSLILRIRPFGHDSKSRNLFDYFCLNLESGKTVAGYTNVYFTPMALSHLPIIISNLLSENAQGIYHVAGETRLSKFEFGQLIALELGLSKDFIRPAEFPNDNHLAIFDSSLSTEKLRSKLELCTSIAGDIGIELSKMKSGE
jgi:dTDP-4-dehydrorhamnose reductase